MFSIGESWSLSIGAVDGAALSDCTFSSSAGSFRAADIGDPGTGVLVASASCSAALCKLGGELRTGSSSGCLELWELPVGEGRLFLSLLCSSPSSWLRSAYWKRPLRDFNYSLSLLAICCIFSWVEVWRKLEWFWNSRLGNWSQVFFGTPEQSIHMTYPNYGAWLLTNHLGWFHTNGPFQACLVIFFYPNTYISGHMSSCGPSRGTDDWSLYAEPHCCPLEKMRAALNSSFSRKRSEAKSDPWLRSWALESSSDTIDAGNLAARPKTACLGLKPEITDMEFLALKHWRSASPNCCKFSMGLRWSILANISWSPYRSILPRCHGAADTTGWIPFSCRKSFQFWLMTSPPSSWEMCWGGPAQSHHCCYTLWTEAWLSRTVLLATWNLVASSRMCKTWTWKPFWPVQSKPSKETHSLNSFGSLRLPGVVFFGPVLSAQLGHV